MCWGLIAISLGVVALVLLGIKLFEGEAAENNANALLAAYQAKQDRFARDQRIPVSAGAERIAA